MQNICGSLSPRVSEMVSLLGQEASSFETARDILQRNNGINLCTSTIQKHSEKVGDFFRQKEGKKYKYAILEVGRDLFENKPKLPKRCYIQVDGAMINTTKGWKENKLGIIFNEADINKRGEGEQERISIKKKQLFSSLGEGVEKFEKRLIYWAYKTNIFQAEEIVVVSDGARWIERMLKNSFSRAIHILDWFHVTDNLWKVSKRLFDQSPEKAKIWVEKYKALIWEGKIDIALKRLYKERRGRPKQEAQILKRLHYYFQRRKHKMQYPIFRKRGYSIGSGAIESANKYAIQSRLKKSRYALVKNKELTLLLI